MMRLYHFVNQEYGLEDIRKRRLKIARIEELNDPFEFLLPDLSDEGDRALVQEWKEKMNEKFGILCFSSCWDNPVLWSHYADKHRGLCLGFEIGENYADKVSYVDSRSSWPDKINDTFVRQLIFSKFSHWYYEKESRAFLEKKEKSVAIILKNLALF